MPRTLVSFIVVLAACSRAPLAAREQVENQARAAANRLKSALMTELTEALQRGGPVAALEVCSGRAQTITRATATPGVRVGRTSHRLRNPSNRAPEWLQATVDAAARGGSVEPGLRELAPGRFGYFEPLVTQPMCATCHGTDLPDELRTAIAARYPQDEAVGFKPGDVRGFVWVEVDSQ